MAMHADERREELRTRLASVLRANRELGSGYEQQAIDQILEATGHPGAKGAGPAAAGAPPAEQTRRTSVPPPPPLGWVRARPGGAWSYRGRPGCGWGVGAWFWPLAILAGLFIVLPVAGSLLMVVIPGLIVFAILAKIGRRMAWRAGAPWWGPVGAPYVRRHGRWRW